MKASRPSSSSLRMSTWIPAASSIAARDLLAVVGVADRRRGDGADLSAPSSRASRTCVATSSETSSIFSAGSRLLPSALLIRV